MSKVSALKREGFKSRQPEKKHEEYEKRKSKLMEAITVEQAINNHRVSTSFSNYRRCVMCAANCGETFSREIDFNDVKDQQFCLLSRPDLMRFQKYFVCSSCESNIDIDEEIEASILVDIKEVHDGNKIRFKPHSLREDDQNEEDIVTQAEPNDVNIQDTRMVTVFFPNSVTCVKEDSQFKVSSKVDPYKQFLKCEKIPKKLLAECYTLQYLKYLSVVKYSKRFTGTIEDFGGKVIGDLTQIADDSHIHGSAKWKEKKLSDMQARIDQTGNSFFKVKIKINQVDEESKATVLVISGKTVTCTFTGDGEMLLTREYLIHPSHDCDTPCPENCEVIPLSQYLEENPVNFLSDKWISVFNSTVYIKMKSLIKNVLGCVNFKMFAEEMTFSLSFDREGHAVIVGAIWSKASEVFNRELSNSSFTGQVDTVVRLDYLSHIDSCLTSTTKPRELQDQFRLSDGDAVKLSNLARKHQTLDENECEFKEMPSLHTMFREVPGQDAMHNIYESRKLVTELRNDLKEKSKEEIDETSTKEWLQELNDFHVTINQNEDGSLIEISIENGEFSFCLDRRLSQLIVKYEDFPFIGIYHYAITCVNYENAASVVLKRLYLEDCLVRTYNPSLLTAMQCQVEVNTVNGFRDWEHLNRTQDERPSFERAQFGVISHDELSINQVANLMTKRSSDQCSRGVVFVNSNKDAKVLFKKVAARTEVSFTARDQNGHFEIQLNSVSRFKMRKNGAEIIQAEFSCWFQFVGSEESSELNNIYGQNLDKIPMSKITSPLSGQLYPSLIICTNGDVLRIRKKKQILTSPR